MMETYPPASSAFLDLGSRAYLIELFPMAAYAVRAPDGVIVWFNSRASELWGRVPVAGDTDERFWVRTNFTVPTALSWLTARPP